MTRQETLENIKNVIEANYCDAECGIFSTPNWFNDETTTIYEDENATVDICYDYSYFEIFGLSKEEFAEIQDYYYAMI